MMQHHILEGLNPQQRTSNLTMTTCLQKTKPLHCMLVHEIIIFSPQLNDFQFPQGRADQQHGTLFLPYTTTKNFLGNILHHHNLHTVRKPNNGARLMNVCRTNHKHIHDKVSVTLNANTICTLLRPQQRNQVLLEC